MTDFPLVVCRASGAVDLLQPSPSGWQATTVALQGRWPVFSPTRDLLAISRVAAEGNDLRSFIEVVDYRGRVVREVYASGKGITPLIAPRVPHYCSWSPGGDKLAFVAQGQFGLTLHVSLVDGLLSADPVINGAPLFINWCGDNNFLAVHSGRELACVETEGSMVTASVSDRALGFRTPAYSDDAEYLAYAVPGEPGVAIMRAIFQGTQSREMHRFPGGSALAFRPGTQELTVAVTRDPESGAFNELWTLDLRSDEPPRRLLNSAFVSFAWSPQGDRILLAVPLQTGDGRYQFVVRDPDGLFIAATEPIIPSADLRAYLGFFDQYSTSHHIWAPDGSSIVVTGRMPGDGVSSSFGDIAGDYVYSWRPEKRNPFEPITAGDIAFFPPLERPVVGHRNLEQG